MYVSFIDWWLRKQVSPYSHCTSGVGLTRTRGQLGPAAKTVIFCMFRFRVRFRVRVRVRVRLELG